jgi:Protein of unknown function (DUF1553)/Protein of unknown function (DUF1549)/Planctomycete cytochrome C
MRFACFVALLCSPVLAADGNLPPAAKTRVDFDKHIRPLLKSRCAKCHSGEKRKGGFSINTRKTVLDGSESETVVVVGNSAKSLLIGRVAETDPDLRMPPKAQKALTKTEIGLLRAWIDQGLKWKDGFSFGTLHRQAELAPRKVTLPKIPGVTHPIDRLLLGSGIRKNSAGRSNRLGILANFATDHVFARRVWLDLLGLLPPVKELDEFAADNRPDKHARLVARLLADRRAYATHWMTWWSDALRNSYRGTGYIDGGRRQITGWLYQSLHDNKPYDAFVRDLVTGANGAEGFIHGIKWRGTVNDSQRREMQAAQNVAQVFLGTNMKCASCHDSFVNHWKLKQSYAFASVFADKPLELHRCDKPIGKIAQVAFLYPQLGTIDAKASPAERRKQLAAIITSKKNGRLSRTIVNRLWAWFFGRGIVEPLDDMDQPPWNQDLLDWLASDLAAHKYDLKRTMTLICTSRAYRMKADPGDFRKSLGPERFTFRGPLVKRMTAEQFGDAVSTLTGVWPKPTRSMQRRDGRGQGGQLAAIAKSVPSIRKQPSKTVRCVFLDANPLLTAMGRPIREQVVTRRDSQATTLQLLELTNGKTLDSQLKAGAKRWLEQSGKSPDDLIARLYRIALSRKPTAEEVKVARGFLGEKPTVESVQDLLWIVAMLPEFQLVR